MKKQLTLVFGVVGLLLLIDQAIKIYIKSNFVADEEVSIFGDWFVLHYIENQGMAFGTTFGSSIWGKFFLSLFRVAAIIVITYYIYREAKRIVKTEYLIVLGLILAGATGNLFDSLFYDLFFEFNPCEHFNQLPGSGIKMKCSDYGFIHEVEVRQKGFMFGNVVDMFQFNITWPGWVPGVGGGQIFPAIWNFADSCITVGVTWMIIRSKTFFPKVK